MSDEIERGAAFRKRRVFHTGIAKLKAGGARLT
jgi:hypothetical protein